MLATAPTEQDGHANRGHGGTVAVGWTLADYGPTMERIDLSTIAVTAGRPPRTPDAPLNTPIVPASSFVAGGPTEYAREGGPTVAAFESLVAGLESVNLPEPAQAIAFSSGMAAAEAVLDLVPLGGRVIAPTTTYTGVAVRLRELHAKGAIDLTLVDVTDTTRIESELKSAADLLWLESPTNPLLEMADLPRLLAAASAADVRTVVDNTFATPVLQRPLELGADLVLHSATKGLSGHSDLLMGVLVTSDDDLLEQLHVRRVLLGAAPSPFDTYLAIRGIRTLALRVERGLSSAQLLASRLETLAQVSKVRQFGTMISIEFNGDAEFAEAVCNRTTIWVHATSLGGVESSLERRRRWPLESVHVPEDLVRLSVGIEDPEDLWTDLRTAIEG
jgi:cystathionine gamma-synthase